MRTMATHSDLGQDASCVSSQAFALADGTGGGTGGHGGGDGGGRYSAGDPWAPPPAAGPELGFCTRVYLMDSPGYAIPSRSSSHPCGYTWLAGMASLKRSPSCEYRRQACRCFRATMCRQLYVPAEAAIGVLHSITCPGSSAVDSWTFTHTHATMPPVRVRNGRGMSVDGQGP